MSAAPPAETPAGTIDFFAAQASAARRARWRFALVLLCVPLVVATINVFMGLALAGIAMDRLPPEALGTIQTEPWRVLAAMPLGFYAVISGVSLLVMANGAQARRRGLRKGSAAFARSLGARPVDRDRPFEEERQLINVADEMALAAQLLPPALYVLDADRESVNALSFAAGPDDIAVILTQGAVLRLPRAELQALVAYALGRVANGDVALNVRMIGWLAGLTAVYAAGRSLVGAPGAVLRHSGDSDGNVGDLGKAGCFFGMIVAFFGGVISLIGSCGYALARWIRALGARQRVLLADATTLQLTRNPAAVDALLRRLQQTGTQRLSGPYREEVGPLLFVPAVGWRCLATHPSLAKRIAALNPEVHRRARPHDVS
ncbi:MAG: M48 family metalloprotease [Burkholderiales bacterium]